jgi:hypothetical protein
MQQDENQQENLEGEQSNSGGSAPEHRRCQYLKADGKQCRDWGVRGQDFCYRHGVFLQPGGRRQIDVPLLEDESSIVLVLSATLRALASGTIPVNNGRLLLDGCRLAHTMQMERQKAAGHRVQRGHKCSCAEEMGEESREAGAETDQPATSPAEPCALRSESCEEPSKEAGPVSEPPNSQHRRFRSREKSWEKNRSKVEGETTDRFDPRNDESRQDFLAARAELLDEWMEEEALAVG